MTPRGRRSGGEDTRGAILESARADFAEKGYDATSLRGVARRAGVDPALIHHYFGGKAELFAQTMQIPVDPAALMEAIVAGPREDVGEALVRTFLRVWDSPEGRQRFEALVRSAVTHEEAARMLREFLTREIFGRITRRLTPDGATGTLGNHELRAGMAAGQMVGMAMMRYIIGFPSVVNASHDELVELVGPTIQRYLAP